MPRSGTAGLGVVLYLAGVAFYSVNDALGKWLWRITASAN